MHAALARLVNNEETRKQTKTVNLPKRSSREAELSPRGAAPRLSAPQRQPNDCHHSLCSVELTFYDLNKTPQNPSQVARDIIAAARFAQADVIQFMPVGGVAIGHIDALVAAVDAQLA